MDIPRVSALIAGALLVVLGLPMIIGFLIAGLWEGFAQTKFTLGFLGFAAYVLATVGLSFLYAARKPEGLGWVLALLYVPAIAALLWLQRGVERSEQDQAVAAAFVEERPEDAVVVTVNEPLRRIVETEDDFHAVNELIQTLGTSENLSVRLRIVKLFAESSPPNGHAHLALRNLYAEMAEKDGPEELRVAVREAILAIAPDDRTLVDELDRWREERSR